MNVQEYIESGILELYVAGSLTERENAEVYEMLQKYPELLSEIEKIEQTASVLTSSVAPQQNKASFKKLLIKMIQEQETPAKVVSIGKTPSKWMQYSGWAASVLVGSTLLFTVLKNTSLKDELKVSTVEKKQYEELLNETKTTLQINEDLLTALRDKNIITIPLQGQKVAPEAYAKVYWNKSKETLYVDVQGLPEPPKGKVYQLWSLKLDPLTPTSLGTMDTFVGSHKIFTVKNPNDSQAFGITLEPEGGSVSPTLEQLYTLGAVTS
ncbi:anti-sigma factor [Tenacibaculum sp. TC6]|uniref:anti-sigma factor n=1 Tax=Tenacibaculum sp. TC6 TaxID=3423223 RepID=UPI003D36C3A6